MPGLNISGGDGSAFTMALARCLSAKCSVPVRSKVEFNASGKSQRQYENG